MQHHSSLSAFSGELKTIIPYIVVSYNKAVQINNAVLKNYPRGFASRPGCVLLDIIKAK